MQATCSGVALAAGGSEGSDGTEFHVSQPTGMGRGVEECRCGTVVREHENRVDVVVELPGIRTLAVDRCLALG